MTGPSPIYCAMCAALVARGLVMHEYWIDKGYFRLNPPTFAQLTEPREGATQEAFKTIDGNTVSLYAVTMVRGTMLCEAHAAAADPLAQTKLSMAPPRAPWSY